MAYVTNSEIESYLGATVYIQLTDDAGTGAADATRVDQARTAAEGEVNSYLARRYQTPVNLAGEPEVSAVIKGVVLALAAYRLHCRRPPVPEDVVRRRNEAAAWLAALADGGVHLPATVAPATTTSAGIVAEARKAERVMTRDELSSW